MMRILGKDGFQAAYEDKDGGFANPNVLKAFQLYKELAALEPFQKGYLVQHLSGSIGGVSRRPGGLPSDGPLGFGRG